MAREIELNRQELRELLRDECASVGLASRTIDITKTEEGTDLEMNWEGYEYKATKMVITFEDVHDVNKKEGKQYKFMIVGFHEGSTTDLEDDVVNNEQVLDYCYDEDEAGTSQNKFVDEGWQEVTIYEINQR